MDDGDPVARVVPSSRRRELARRAVVADLATTLHVGEHAAGTLADHSEVLRSNAPRTLAALRRGNLSWSHATQIAKHVADLSPDEAARVESVVLDVAAACTPAQLGVRARRAREDVHPVPADVRHAEATERRAVYLDDGRDGMAWLTAHLPATLAHAAFDRLTRAGRHLRSDGERRTTDQLQADVLAALLLDDGTLDGAAAGRHVADAVRGAGSTTSGPDDAANAPGDAPGSWAPRPSPLAVLARSIRPRVTVTVPVLTLLGRADAPATLDGTVPVDAETARQLAALAPSFRRILTHPETGVTLSVGRSSYAVPADLRALLRERDRTCRFPGCTRPAHRTDLDHTVAWADGGTTAADNLAFLCRRHHITKHRTRWTVRQVPDGPRPAGGVLEWTSPTGRVHRTLPSRPDTTLHRTLPVGRHGVPRDTGPPPPF